MSTEEIRFELVGSELGGTKEIKDHPAVEVFSRTKQAKVPARAFMYNIESQRVCVEYDDRQAAPKWVTLESLQKDNGDRIKLLLGDQIA